MRALAALSLLFACGPAARGQEEGAPKVEVGAQFTSLAVNLPDPVFGFPVISPGDPGTDPEAGFGARLIYNLSDPSRRFMTRFDFGDTIIRYDRRHEQTFFLSQNVLEISPETKHNFQFSAGLGFRF